MLELTSRQNPKIKLARALTGRKKRQETGLFLVEGLRHLGELAESDFHPEFVLYAPESLTSEFGQDLIERFRGQGTEVYSTTTDILDDLSGKNAALGALAVVQQKAFRLDEIPHQAGRPSVAVVSPQDPGNIGTILRAMDAFQAGALLLLNGGADPWQPVAVRASMGAIFWHPLVQTDFAAFADWAQETGIRVYGTSAHGAEDLHNFSGYAPPAALLLGSEREGLSPEQTARCDILLRIPMRGRSTSLNLAIAAGIFLYEMSRR